MQTLEELGVVDLFTSDNFSSRRTTGNNLYDPESLLTGWEIAEGLSYRDKRVYKKEQDYRDACEGKYTPSEIAALFPRTKREPTQPGELRGERGELLRADCVEFPLLRAQREGEENKKFSQFTLEILPVTSIEPTEKPEYSWYIMQDGNVVKSGKTEDLTHAGRAFMYEVSSWQIANGRFGRDFPNYWKGR